MSRKLALLVIAASLMSMPLAAGASRLRQGESPLSPALSRLASCVAGKKRLAVVFLIDESGSLKHTDPANSRVVAAQAAIRGLNGLVARGAGKIRVDVQVAGF